MVRVLLLSDTHVGFDLPARSTSGRRIRGHDFIANFERALAPAHRGEADLVVHAGDLFDQPDPPAGVAEIAYALLRAVADRGVPVLVLPGNHERARFPCPLLAMHPMVWRFDHPRTFTANVGATRVAIGGFPYARRVRSRFPALVDETGLRRADADVRLLAIHHCVQGAAVSLPGGGDFVFSTAQDVIAARDIPPGVAAVLSGHIHRHQVLELASPVVYCGSVERTAFAEMREDKGFVQLELQPTADGGQLRTLVFNPLPARPMVRARIDPEADVGPQVRRVLEGAADDAIVRLEVPGEPRTLPGLGAAALRRAAPRTMNVFVAFDDREPPMAMLSRARRARGRT